MLNHLIAFDTDGRAVWPAEQLKSALRQDLGSSLQAVLDDCALAEGLSAGATPPIASFQDLLHHKQPPLDLLGMAKDYAKLSRDDPASPLPPDVALVLYYGSIAAALLRHGVRISRLEDDDLRSGFNWSVRQSWLDARTRQLFMDALRLLRSSLLRWRL